MSLDNFISALADYRLPVSLDDDWVDRLSHVWTVSILVAASIIVTSKQYMGNAMECFCPDDRFDEAKRAYAVSYCWLKNTYSVSLEKPLPADNATRGDQEVAYYKWVHVLLLVLAALFKMPNWIWRIMRPVDDLGEWVGIVASTKAMPRDKANDTIRQTKEVICQWLDAKQAQRRARRRMCCHWLSRYCSKLCCARTLSCLLMKLLYLSVCLLVWDILHRVVGDWFYKFGYTFLQSLDPTETRNPVPPDMPYFPKVTYCDMPMRQMQNTITYTLQCTLPINMFNEIIFALLWLWLHFVTFCSAIGVLYTVFCIVFRPTDIVQALDDLGELTLENDKREARRFQDEYLGRDGAFIIDTIASNCSAFKARSLLKALWRDYRGWEPTTGKCPQVQQVSMAQGDAVNAQIPRVGMVYGTQGMFI